MPRPASRLNYPCPISLPWPSRGAKAVALRPGKPVDELARLGIDPAAIVKLASNENPLGAKALEAIRAELAERPVILTATVSNSSASWPSVARWMRRR